MTEYNFIINPEIEMICEAKAKKEYELQKAWKERKPAYEIDVESMIQGVKEEIYHKRLILKPKDVSISEFVNSQSEVRRAWFLLREEYAKKAVEKIMGN
jgi:hypothetical protein